MIYQQLAAIYDELMSHVPYPRWSHYINQLVLHYGGTQNLTLDAACGTGSFLAHFAPNCRKISGFDRSADMIELARQRFRSSRTPASFVQADLLEWSTTSLFDLVLCLYDSINYMMNRAELIRALSNLCGSLGEGGLLIFDVSTLHNARNNFHRFEETETVGEMRYTRLGTLDRTNRILHNDFTLRRLDSQQVYEEHHRQRLYSLREVRSAMFAAGLDCLEILDGFTFNEGSEESERVHFIGRRRN